MISITEQDIKYIISECIGKLVINESIDEYYYHYTTLNGLYDILGTNSFILSDMYEELGYSVGNGRYCLSVTRQKYAGSGYAITSTKDILVRICLSKSMLKNRYHIIPFSYLAKNKNTTLSKYYNGNVPNVQEYSECEDRLVSNSEIISNALKYIKRIDIMCYNIKSIINNLSFGNDTDNICLYSNRKDFDFQTDKCLRYNELKDCYNDVEKLYGLSKQFNLNGILSNKDLGNGRTLIYNDWNMNVLDKSKGFLYPNGRFSLKGNNIVYDKDMDKKCFIDKSGIINNDIWFDSIEWVKYNELGIISNEGKYGIYLIGNGLVGDSYYNDIIHMDANGEECLICDKKEVFVYSKGNIRRIH